MVIGVPKEIKDQEHRVAIVPSGVEELVLRNHDVLIQAGAGTDSGISDSEYRSAGARIAKDAAAVWGEAQLVMKIKEPLPQEYPYLRRGHILFAFLHLAPFPDLVRVLLEREVLSVAYETIQLADGSLPLLSPMSQIAGKMSVQIGAALLQKERGGKGILLGGVPGVRRGRVCIIGGGNVGLNAARVACGLGAEATVLDTSHARLTHLDEVLGGKVVTLMSNRRNIRESLAEGDLLVGAVLAAGAQTPRLISREDLRGVRKGSVFVDVSIDQGGISETSRPTSHTNPTYLEEGVIHYCVPNIPGSVPMTSTWALTNVTLPYCVKIAGGIETAVSRDRALAAGVNTWGGRVTCRPVAEAQGRECSALGELLG